MGKGRDVLGFLRSGGLSAADRKCCPYCGDRLDLHCAGNPHCAWLKCRNDHCRAFGPLDHMVRIDGATERVSGEETS